MPFLTEPEPPRGIATDVLPGIRRLVARNPSVMTYHGTNTYLIENDVGLTVLDPGPRDDEHVRDLLAAAGGRINKIVITHIHSDHSGAVAALREATGAPVYSHENSKKDGFDPDFRLKDGDRVGGLTGLFTPGHACDHLSFEFIAGDAGKILFSGDHVMSWSSSIVSPPDGDMRDYYRSLELLLSRDEIVYLAGHGPMLPAPRILVGELLAHRQKREAAILQRLQRGPGGIAVIAAELYEKANLWLKLAARQNVLAHLLKLKDEGIVTELPPGERVSEALTGLDPQMVKLIENEGGAELERMEKLGARRFALV
jgi:glyoxylase-like metal-dependent hydrolase (beta-lactamase superfamily II)